ncbi:hypothetical protein IscW_ISCW006120 [Ixodes scapularis]|uniref:GH18 domain-containing protein n=1 Tax=Ixodes scapularis TaxID=6945 RepID=B7PKK0_IXOSC|nr:hypothetical protein IscW_ISCW006120 [Ixodes scapularis]|eukprot:XP_002400635.1 hypothetical protein IscW_ISCW006120 [Ixodes scapularis]
MRATAAGTKIHSGRRANGRVFEATTFPHEFCDNIVFCCASIGDAFQLLLEPPAVFALATIAQLKRAARKHLEVSLAIGGTAQDNAAFRKLADDAEGSRVNLVVNLASLLEPLGADAVFLHWAYPALEERDSLTLLVTDMVRSLLVEARLELGVVVPADPRACVGFDLLALSKVGPSATSLTQ